MKVVLAGAFGNLGADILKCLVADGTEKNILFILFSLYQQQIF